MRRIAVINQKGGVGKTTTVANLGAALARRGRSVLLVDLDPQAHLTLHYGIELADDQPSIYDVLIESTPIEKVALEVRENMTLIPADIDLAAADAELISVMGREVILREALETVESDYDVMLIDCPPSLGILTINALAVSRQVVIPLQAQFFALQGLSKLLDTVTLVRQRINTTLTVDGIVLCLHESATRLAGEVVADLNRFLEAARGANVPWADACIYATCIRRNIKLAEASSFGKSIFEYAPRSHGAADYEALAAEIFSEIDGLAPQFPQPVEVASPPCADAAPRIAAADQSSAGVLSVQDEGPPATSPTPTSTAQPVRVETQPSDTVATSA